LPGERFLKNTASQRRKGDAHKAGDGENWGSSSHQGPKSTDGGDRRMGKGSVADIWKNKSHITKVRGGVSLW